MMSLCWFCRGWSGTRPTGGSFRSLSCAKEFPWADVLHRYLQCYLHPGFMGPSQHCILLSPFIAWKKGALSCHPPNSKTFASSVFDSPPENPLMMIFLLSLFLVLLWPDQNVKLWKQEQNGNGHDMWYLLMVDLDVPVVINLACSPVWARVFHSVIPEEFLWFLWCYLTFPLANHGLLYDSISQLPELPLLSKE